MSEPTRHLEECFYCDGSGYVQRTPKKSHGSIVKCVYCDGSGKAIVDNVQRRWLLPCEVNHEMDKAAAVKAERKDELEFLRGLRGKGLMYILQATRIRRDEISAALEARKESGE